MNNRCVAKSFYPASADSSNHLIETLHHAVDHDADPCQVLAAYLELAEQDMADIMGCSLQTYQNHVNSYGGSVRALALSPLSGRNILNLCASVGVHPADLCKVSASPQSSCPPHIFDAIMSLAKGGGYADDRKRAFDGIQQEEARYHALLTANPMCRNIFQQVAEHARFFAEETRGCVGQAVESIKTPQLRSALSEAFSKNGYPDMWADLDFYDYQAAHHYGFAEVEALLRQGKKELRFEKHKLKKDISTLFGTDSHEDVLNAAEQMIDNLHKVSSAPLEDYPGFICSDLAGSFSVQPGALDRYRADHNLPHETDIAILGHISDRIFAYHHLKNENFLSEKESRNLLGQLQQFDRWLDEVEGSNLFYLEYLYINHARGDSQSANNKIADPHPK